MALTDLKHRNTTSKKIPQINSLYVYKTRHKAKFTKRQQPGKGYRYMVNKALLNAGEGEINIYHRTVEIAGVTNGLTLVTFNSKFRDVQKWFNEQIEVIESDAELTKKFLAAKTSPQELGIRYGY